MASDTKEFFTMKHNQCELIDKLGKTVDVANFARMLNSESEALLPRDIVDVASEECSGIRSSYRMAKVIDAVQAQISLNAELFQSFLKVLKLRNLELWKLLHRFYSIICEAPDILTSVPNWKELGSELKIHQEEILSIETECKGDRVLCRERLVRVWLKGDEEASWVKLCRALEELGCEAEVGLIKEKYIRHRFTDHDAMNSHQHDETANIDRTIEELDDRFRDIFVRIQEELCRHLSVMDLRHTLSILPSTIKTEHRHFFLTTYRAIQVAEDFISIFLELSEYCSFLNYSLLHYIIRCHSSEIKQEIQDDMKCYERDIETFKEHTTVNELLDAKIDFGCEVESPPNLSRLEAKFKRDTNCTLQDLDKYRRKIGFKYNLTSSILLLRSARSGSLILTWCIPTSEAHHFVLASSAVWKSVSSDLLYLQVDMATLTSPCIDPHPVLQLHAVTLQKMVQRGVPEELVNNMEALLIEWELWQYQRRQLLAEVEQELQLLQQQLSEEHKQRLLIWQQLDHQKKELQQQFQELHEEWENRLQRRLQKSDEWQQIPLQLRFKELEPKLQHQRELFDDDKRWHQYWQHVNEDQERWMHDQQRLYEDEVQWMQRWKQFCEKKLWYDQQQHLPQQQQVLEQNDALEQRQWDELDLKLDQLRFKWNQLQNQIQTQRKFILAMRLNLEVNVSKNSIEAKDSQSVLHRSSSCPNLHSFTTVTEAQGPYFLLIICPYEIELGCDFPCGYAAAFIGRSSASIDEAEWLFKNQFPFQTYAEASVRQRVGFGIEGVAHFALETHLTRENITVKPIDMELQVLQRDVDKQDHMGMLPPSLHFQIDMVDTIASCDFDLCIKASGLTSHEEFIFHMECKRKK